MSHQDLRSLFLDRTDEIVDDRFFSRAACRTLAKRVESFMHGGGDCGTFIDSWWNGTARWARNRVNLAEDQRLTRIGIARSIRGAAGSVYTDQFDDVSLAAAVEASEYLTKFQGELPFTLPPDPPPKFDYLKTKVWSDASYNLSATERQRVAQAMIDAAESAGASSAGRIGARIGGTAFSMNNGQDAYCPTTRVECSVTMRDPKAGASGWAGASSYDWLAIDSPKVTARALEKCIASRNPVAVEPGRWTVVLEPQAVYDLVNPLMAMFGRESAEYGVMSNPFHDPSTGDCSRLGQRVLSESITISHDPMDPELGVVPFTPTGDPFRSVTWIEHGILKALSYDRGYAIPELNEPMALPGSGAFRIVGGTSSVDEMIQGTERGLLITRLSGVNVVNPFSCIITATTRDGVWLIQKGKIAKPVKNFRVVESPLFALNNVVQVGASVPVFSPYVPAAVPPLMIRDFNLPSLSDAI